MRGLARPRWRSQAWPPKLARYNKKKGHSTEAAVFFSTSSSKVQRQPAAMEYDDEAQNGNVIEVYMPTYIMKPSEDEK